MGCRGSHCNQYYTPCKKVGSPCAGHDGSYNDYRCTGHTDKRKENTGNFHTYSTSGGGQRPYSTGDIVVNPNINMLRAEILKEINVRKINPLYTGLNGQSVISEVRTGDLIDHTQQNSLANAVKALAQYANANHGYGDNSLGEKNETPHISNSGEVLSAQSDLVSLEKDLDAHRWTNVVNNLTAIMQDCICHTDCSLFNQGGKFICSCYGYCCHYGNR